LSLTLLPDLEKRLKLAAARQGMSADELAIQVLDQALPSDERRAGAMAMLQDWNNEPDEPDEPGYDFFQSLDDARPSFRKLYPPELKGKSW
jgi:plasmid stability protein